jgi:hypothetical protein
MDSSPQDDEVAPISFSRMHMVYFSLMPIPWPLKCPEKMFTMHVVGIYWPHSTLASISFIDIIQLLKLLSDHWHSYHHQLHAYYPHFIPGCCVYVVISKTAFP